jgi:membrane protein DedA with SNARE-associated domain
VLSQLENGYREPWSDRLALMNEAFEFLRHHGYALLFGWVLAEQIGLPIPSLPILLALGALAGAKEVSFWLAFALAVLASLLADWVWYQLGRERGHSILKFLCRISLEPDSCVRRTEDAFASQGGRALLLAKFLPGLSTVAPPLAGMLGMRLGRFVAWDAAGAALWVGAYSGVGYIFSRQLDRVALYAIHLRRGVALLVAAAFTAYLTWKYVERRRFIRSLRIARITPEELKQRLDAGEPVVVVDLRHSNEFEAENVKVPGALHLLPEELEQRHEEIPRDREVVLYCT